MSKNLIRAATALLALGMLGASGAWAQSDTLVPRSSDPAGTRCRSTLHMTTLHFIIATGGDDLRGGNDNVMLYAQFAGSPDWFMLQRRGGLNSSARWADWSMHTVDVTVAEGPCQPPPGFITGLRLQTTSGGGMGGDNWNLQSVDVEWIGTDADGKRVTGMLAHVPAPERGGYRHRFTGDDNAYEIPLLPTRADPSGLIVGH